MIQSYASIAENAHSFLKQYAEEEGIQRTLLLYLLKEVMQLIGGWKEAYC